MLGGEGGKKKKKKKITKQVTAILEAGRRSIDENGREIKLIYDDNREVIDLE